jgi:hypothetical protein
MESRHVARDALRQVRDALARLQYVERESIPDRELARVMFDTSMTMLGASYALMTSSSLGECRKDTPYAAVKPVIDEHGQFHWCCEHQTEHCV